MERNEILKKSRKKLSKLRFAYEIFPYVIFDSEIESSYILQDIDSEIIMFLSNQEMTT